MVLQPYDAEELVVYHHLCPCWCVKYIAGFQWSGFIIFKDRGALTFSSCCFPLPFYSLLDPRHISFKLSFQFSWCLEPLLRLVSLRPVSLTFLSDIDYACFPNEIGLSGEHKTKSASRENDAMSASGNKMWFMLPSTIDGYICGYQKDIECSGFSFLFITLLYCFRPAALCWVQVSGHG